MCHRTYGSFSNFRCPKLWHTSSFISLPCCHPVLPGHWLGLDVHDCATVPATEPLQPGVVSGHAVYPRADAGYQALKKTFRLLCIQSLSVQQQLSICYTATAYSGGRHAVCFVSPQTHYCMSKQWRNPFCNVSQFHFAIICKCCYLSAPGVDN